MYLTTTYPYIRRSEIYKFVEIRYFGLRWRGGGLGQFSKFYARIRIGVIVIIS